MEHKEAKYRAKLEENSLIGNEKEKGTFGTKYQKSSARKSRLQKLIVDALKDEVDETEGLCLEIQIFFNQQITVSR